MKKRLFGTLLAAALIVSQAMSVFAADSKIGEVAVAGDSVGYYELRMVGGEEDMPGVTDEAVIEKILAVNAGEESLQSVAELAPDLEDILAGKVLLTKFFDLVPINGGAKTEDGKYTVTLSVSTLTAAVTDVGLLHYSTARQKWEVVAPEDVDYDSKEITIEFEDLSPVAVIGKVNDAAADNTVGTSPKTGAVSGWMIWMGAAIVLITAGAVTYRRSRR